MRHNVDVFTIGVYGKTDQQFFDQLRTAHVDLFCDIRQRRGLRGSQYAFANSKKLQGRLSAEGIRYRHVPELAPSSEIRVAQKRADLTSRVTKRGRSSLDSQFVALYRRQLDTFDFDAFFDSLSDEVHRVVFFCVEAEAAACHRSLVAAEISARYGIDPIHL